MVDDNNSNQEDAIHFTLGEDYTDEEIAMASKSDANAHYSNLPKQPKVSRYELRELWYGNTALNSSALTTSESLTKLALEYNLN